MIAYSSRGAAAFETLGIPSDRVTLALNAVGAAPGPVRSGGVRPSGQLRVLYVGRLQARKRVDVLIKACAVLEEPPGLVIVGEGPERAALETLADRILPAVHFAGHLEGRALDEAFARADVFVLPGTGGLAVQQAMAHGLPVVVGEGDGTADDLVRPANGWRIAPGDVPGLATILRQADGDRTALARMGAESRRIAAQEVNIESMVDAFVKAITNASGGG
jgi:glycosyltransferase involved in cell wall biosynthesis